MGARAQGPAGGTAAAETLLQRQIRAGMVIRVLCGCPGVNFWLVIRKDVGKTCLGCGRPMAALLEDIPLRPLDEVPIEYPSAA